MFCAFNLTAALATVVAAQDAVTADLDAWGAAQTPARKAGGTEAGDIHGLVDTKEDALQTYITNNKVGLGVAADTYDSTDATDVYVDGSATDKFGAMNAVEDANLAAVKAQITAKEVTLDAAVASKTAALVAVEVGTTTVGVELKAAVDAYNTAFASIAVANTAFDNAKAAMNSALAALDAGSDAVTSAMWDGTSVLTIGITAGGVTNTYKSSYDAKTKVWSNDNAALNAIDLTNVQAKAVAELSAGKAITSAEDLTSARLLAVEKIDATQTTGIAYDGTNGADVDSDGWVDGADKVYKMDGATEGDTIGLTVDSASDAYNVATTAVKTFDTLVAGFNKAAAAVEAARLDSAELLALEKAVTTAEKAITDEGYGLITLDGMNDVVFGSSKADVIVLDSTLSAKPGTATVYSFAAGDVLNVGAAHTLGTASEYTKANDAVLEVFLKQDGSNTLVTLETKAFGDTASAGQISVITLVGVNAADLELANGYIQLA